MAHSRAIRRHGHGSEEEQLGGTHEGYKKGSFEPSNGREGKACCAAAKSCFEKNGPCEEGSREEIAEGCPREARFGRLQKGDACEQALGEKGSSEEGACEEIAEGCARETRCGLL